MPAEKRLPITPFFDFKYELSFYSFATNIGLTYLATFTHAYISQCFGDDLSVEKLAHVAATLKVKFRVHSHTLLIARLTINKAEVNLITYQADEALKLLGVKFTTKEYAVLSHVLSGKSKSNITTELGMAINTYKHHITAINKKLNTTKQFDLLQFLYL
ncbi:MAG: Bacterial regulatory protein luxR family [Bacteroidota bacterium]|jgi:DNA-binding NarL/FixJ family response regulator